jgi:hypothetical protein
MADVRCAECRRLARALHLAWRADNDAFRLKARRVADASGRDVRQFGVDWVFSLATMPDEEMRAVLDSHYPTLAEARRASEAHELAAGHSLKGWWMLRGYLGDAP